MRKILTEEQIQEAKILRALGSTKRQLAFKYEVGATTIYENVFATTKRFRIFKSSTKIKQIRIPCARCEIALTRDIKGRYIPLNFQMGNICIACYLEEHHIDYSDILHI